MYRRSFLTAALGAAVAAAVPTPAMSLTTTWSWTVQTLEAFTDTLIPGAKRYPGDIAVAGSAPGPGGADAGYLALLTDPAVGTSHLLGTVAGLLNVRATAYALNKGIILPSLYPPFVGLAFRHRTAVVHAAFGLSDPDRDLWVIMALLSSLSFDAAVHLHTRTALQQHHPGLRWLGFPDPGADGLWRYPEHSYRRVLADLHPGTSSGGNPA
ncbi:DUF5987 family protein [Kribbella deserti]|uniref:DUF5987 family protein n=1 Tax=Kribbella deserti TaxID=1926257 RepID=A0ABV6QN13_9ACTN